MKEGLIDMMGTVFANRQAEAEKKLKKDPEYLKDEQIFHDVYHVLLMHDKKAAFNLESAVTALNVHYSSEAYIQGVRDGVAMAQAILQDNTEPFSVIKRKAAEAVRKAAKDTHNFSSSQIRPFTLKIC